MNSTVSRQSSPKPRMVVPDVARGMALLGIAIANLPTAWAHSPDAGLPGNYFGGVYNDSLLDKAAVVFGAMFAHVRGLPMFSTLLGFGVGLITMSLWRRHFPLPRTRAVLIRRYTFLAVFGLIHLVFIFPGDIMLMYGICGVIIAFMVPLRDKIVQRIAWIALGITMVVGTIIGVLVFIFGDDFNGAFSSDSAMFTGAETYLGFLGENLLQVLGELMLFVLFMFPFFSVMLIGFTWARRGVLAHAELHRGELMKWAIATVAVVVLIGLPWGLSSLGILPRAWESGLNILNQSFGPLTGPGILAALALLLDGVQKSTEQGAALPVWLRPFSALGKRSMSGYLGQSVILFFLVYPFTLGLGDDWSAATHIAVAFVVWLTTLLFAWALELADKPGPFEWIHRRLAYGPTGKAQLNPKQRGRTKDTNSSDSLTPGRDHLPGN